MPASTGYAGDPVDPDAGCQCHDGTRLRVSVVQQLKADASRDLTVGGADLASQALNAGLVDECILLVWPMAVGHGKPALPSDASFSLELLDERRFANGVLLLLYRPQPR